VGQVLTHTNHLVFVHVHQEGAPQEVPHARQLLVVRFHHHHEVVGILHAVDLAVAEAVEELQSRSMLSVHLKKITLMKIFSLISK